MYYSNEAYLISRKAGRARGGGDKITEFGTMTSFLVTRPLSEG